MPPVDLGRELDFCRLWRIVRIRHKEQRVQNKRFLSPSEVAEELSVSPSTVLRLIHDDRLPAIRVSDRIYRIPVAAFERYKAGSIESPVPARIPLGTRKRPVIGAGESLPETADPIARVRRA